MGNVRTALFNWLMAQQARGIFLLRIEDTDVSRSSEAAVSALVEDLLAVNNTLARLGHYYPNSRLMRMDELVLGFSTAHLGRAPARFDLGQLDRWQKEAVVQAEGSAQTDSASG